MSQETSQETNTSSWLEWSKKWLNSLVSERNDNTQTRYYGAQYSLSEVSSVIEKNPEQGLLSRMFSFFKAGLVNTKPSESSAAEAYLSSGSSQAEDDLYLSDQDQGKGEQAAIDNNEFIDDNEVEMRNFVQPTNSNPEVGVTGQGTSTRKGTSMRKRF